MYSGIRFKVAKSAAERFPCFYIVVTILVSVLTMVTAQPEIVSIEVDATVAGEAITPVWSYFGYDECNYSTTAGGRALTQTVVKANRSKVYLRPHFLLNTGDGAAELKWGSTNVYTEDVNGNPVYTWTIMDEIMDAIVNAGALPLAEISFMPQALSSHTGPYRNSGTYSLDGGCFYPPNDYEKWAELIRAWAQHSLDRYPGMDTTWLWEVWNEPNLPYWQGSFAEYCRLYDYTEFGLHEVAPKALLGGPHVAGPDVTFLREFLKHCNSGINAVTGQTGTRLDFVGFHAKGGVTLINGNVHMNLGGQLQLHRNGFSTVHEFPDYRNTPIIIGEADPDGCAACPASNYPQADYRNVSAYGAYEVATMKHSIDLAKNIGVNLRGIVTWAWMFDDQPYFLGFRTLSTNGIHKPVLNAFKMLGRMIGNRVPLVSSGALGLETIINQGVRGARPDIDGLAMKNDSGVQIIVWNYHDELVYAPDDSLRLRVTLPDEYPPWIKMRHFRVDSNHSNAFTAWLAMGSPQAPTQKQLETLHVAMQLQEYASLSRVDINDGAVSLGFSLSRQGVSLVELMKPILGCTNTGFAEYDATAEWDDGNQCVTPVTSRPFPMKGFQVTADGISVAFAGAYAIYVYDMNGVLVLARTNRGPRKVSLEKLRKSGVYWYRIEASNQFMEGRLLRLDY